jgi:ribosomal protein S18 acetylase RimI-like enzyme
MSNSRERPFDGNLQIHDYSRGEDRREDAADARADIGYWAWLSQFDRSEPEIFHVFRSARGRRNFMNTLSSIQSENQRAQKRTAHLALRGSGVVLVARLPELSRDPVQQSIGYIIARNDRSGSLPHRLHKAYREHQPPYMWIQSLNVRPDFGFQGVGSALVAAALGSFHDRQKPTAYVFDENRGALKFFTEHLGFRVAPPEQEPQPQEGFFGYGTEPPWQWRLEAESVAQVRSRISDRLDNRLPEFARV